MHIGLSNNKIQKHNEYMGNVYVETNMFDIQTKQL